MSNRIRLLPVLTARVPEEIHFVFTIFLPLRGSARKEWNLRVYSLKERTFRS